MDSILHAFASLADPFILFVIVAGTAAGRPGRALGRWLVGGAPDATRRRGDDAAAAL